MDESKWILFLAKLVCLTYLAFGHFAAGTVGTAYTQQSSYTRCRLLNLSLLYTSPNFLQNLSLRIAHIC